MSTAARQLAPFVRLRPRPTAGVYVLLVRLRRAVLAHAITEVVPELDALVDRTISLARDERHLAHGAHPAAPPTEALELAAQLAAPLQAVHQRLTDHTAHPGVAALLQHCFPRGLAHLLALPVRSLHLDLDALLGVLMSPAHLPYVETAGLVGVVRELLDQSRSLDQVLHAHPLPTAEALALRQEALHHELSLLWVRVFASCWSDRPAHAHCRAHLLQIWSASPPPEPTPVRTGEPPSRARPTALPAARGWGRPAMSA